jgi:hypothetical protein
LIVLLTASKIPTTSVPSSDLRWPPAYGIVIPERRAAGYADTVARASAGALRPARCQGRESSPRHGRTKGSRLLAGRPG